MGGEAVANGDSVSSWEGAQRLDQHSDRDLRRSPRGRQQRRHLARSDADQHDRGGMGRGHQRAPEGHVRAEPLGRRVLARAGQGRQAGRRADHQHHLGQRHLRQPRSDQLRRGQGRHRGVHQHRRARAGALRRHGQRRRTGRADPHDRRPRPGSRDRRGARDALAALDRSDRHVAGVGGVEGRHRSGVRGQRRRAGDRRRLGAWAAAGARSRTPRRSVRSCASCWRRHA